MTGQLNEVEKKLVSAAQREFMRRLYLPDRNEDFLRDVWVSTQYGLVSLADMIHELVKERLINGWLTQEIEEIQGALEDLS